MTTKKQIIQLFVIIILIATIIISNDKYEILKKANSNYQKLATMDYRYDGKITYVPTKMYEYFNYIDDDVVKLFYDACYNMDFKKSKENIYFFENSKKYSFKTENRGIFMARLDHPELELFSFVSTNYRYNNPLFNMYLKSIIWTSEDYSDSKRKLKEVDNVISPLVERVNNTNDLRSKYHIIYDYLTSTITYDDTKGYNNLEREKGKKNSYNLCTTKTDDVQNIYGALVNKVALCDGMSDAFKYLCNKCDLECITVIGSLDDEVEENGRVSHAWNIVPIEGKWKLVDVTYGTVKAEKYFLNDDIYSENRKPYNMGFYVPGYDETS